jgi:A/G-specific adenine glycosylase
MSYTKFRNLVWKYYREHGRHDLSWRKTHDPYKILVSEVMLQQTQVERVVLFYKNFLKKFPTERVLARAPLREVLIGWQGLGYNRRAQNVACGKRNYRERRVSERSVSELEALPGIGSYCGAGHCRICL